jgi:hypothetical protein
MTFAALDILPKRSIYFFDILPHHSIIDFHKRCGRMPEIKNRTMWNHFLKI